MMSKKDALVLGAAVIGGAGLGLMVLGKGKEEGEEGEEEPETKKEMLIRYEAPVYAPSEVYAPYTESNITDIIHNVITRVISPAPTPPPAPPIPSRGVIPSERRSVMEEAMVKKGATPEQAAATLSWAQSQLEGGYRGTGMTVSEYKSQFAERTYSTSPTGQAVTPKKTPSDASKAIAHAKRLRAGRGD